MDNHISFTQLQLRVMQVLATESHIITVASIHQSCLTLLSQTSQTESTQVSQSIIFSYVDSAGYTESRRTDLGRTE